MTLSNFGLSVENLTALILLYALLFLVIAVIITVLFYLKGFGIYKMSRTLKIKRSWYGFVPVLNVFALGRLADVADKKDTNIRKTILTLYILKTVLSVVFTVFLISGLVEVLFAADAAVFEGEKLKSDVFYCLAPAFYLLCGAVILNFVYQIVNAICAAKIYSVFGASAPKFNAMLGFILPIFIPFFIYTVSKNDPIEQKSNSSVDGAVFSIDE